MKKLTSFLLALLLGLSFLTACAAKQPTETSPKETSPATPTPTEEPVEEEIMKYEFGVYNILTADGEHKVCYNSKGLFSLDDSKEERSRFTLQVKKSTYKKQPKSFYAVYIGDDTNKAMGISSFLVEEGKTGSLLGHEEGYAVSDKYLWTVEDNDDGTCRFVPKTSLTERPICLAVSGNDVVVARRDDNDPAQLFRIEKAPAHKSYVEFRSAKGNFIARIHKATISKSTGITAEMMQNWTDFMQEAYEKEIELTGFVPYDLIVFSGWEDLQLAAGVSDNYNVITAGKGFATSEFRNMAQRNNDPKLNMIDMSFGFLHELGHMFDSQRGWNFESEAWTDLKLCYVIYKMTLDHQSTDKLVFGCASSDYPAAQCFTYEEMAKALDIHAKKGAMTTVYGFFGAARLFLLMTYDFGWEPFIRTFHWFQDNGYTQNSFDRWTRFTTFVDKLSEFSGKDIKNDYLTPENWQVFEDYYTGKSTTAV